MPTDPTDERWPHGSPGADELYPQAGPQRRGSAAARTQPDWWDVAEEGGAEGGAIAARGAGSRASSDADATREAGPGGESRSIAASAAGGNAASAAGRNATTAGGPRRRSGAGAGARSKAGPRGTGGASAAAESSAPTGSDAAASGPKVAGADSTKGAGDSAAQGAAEAVSGPELARAVIDAALTKRREAARNPRRRTGEGTGKRLRGYSGPGPDPRDPQLFGDMLGRLMKSRGWEKPKAEATVFGAWEKVVGADIAAHSRPIKLDDGVLTVEAESTAWATQLRMLAAGLLRSIAAEVGHNVVKKLNIHGPAAPSWAKGPRRVQGRGPRDTYG